MKVHKGKTILAAILFAASYLYSKSDLVVSTPKIENKLTQQEKNLDKIETSEIVKKKSEKKTDSKSNQNKIGKLELNNGLSFGGKEILNIASSRFHEIFESLNDAEILEFTNSSTQFMENLAKRKCRDFSCVSKEEESKFKRILNYHLEIAGIRGVFSPDLAKLALEQSLNLKLDRSAQELALDYLGLSMGSAASIEYLADYHPSDLHSVVLRDFLRENKDSLAPKNLDTYSFLFEVNAFSRDKYSANTFAKSLNQIQNLEQRLPELSQKFCSKLKELTPKDKKDYVSSYYIGLRKAGLGKNQVPEC